MARGGDSHVVTPLSLTFEKTLAGCEYSAWHTPGQTGWRCPCKTHITELSMPALALLKYMPTAPKADTIAKHCPHVPRVIRCKRCYVRVTKRCELNKLQI